MLYAKTIKFFQTYFIDDCWYAGLNWSLTALSLTDVITLARCRGTGCRRMAMIFIFDKTIVL